MSSCPQLVLPTDLHDDIWTYYELGKTFLYDFEGDYFVVTSTDDYVTILLVDYMTTWCIMKERDITVN